MFHIKWSSEDMAFVGTCEEFPSLSYISKHPLKAIWGIKNLVKECVDEIEYERKNTPTS